MNNIKLLNITARPVFINKCPVYIGINKNKNKYLKTHGMLGLNGEDGQTNETNEQRLVDLGKENTMAILENVVKKVAQENEAGQNTNENLLLENTENDDKIEKTVKCYLKTFNISGEEKKFYECGICSRDFQHQYTLTRHLPIHTNDRNFCCNVCGRSFRQFSTLSQHRAIHSTERPFHCGICKKSFNRASTLISHKKTHSNEKEFRCHICNKAFHQKGNLRNHVYIHTNERPYKCSICGKGFNQMSNLQCHNQKSHFDKCLRLWKCNFCDCSFSKRINLRSHELEAHQMSINNCKSSRNPNRAVADQVTGITKLTDEDHEDIQIPAINTAAKRSLGVNTPFAILFKIDKAPYVVKIVDCENGSVLKSIIHEDFTMTDQQGQILIPIIAHIHETINSIGERQFLVKPPEENLSNDVNQDQEINTKIDLNHSKNICQTDNTSLPTFESSRISINSGHTWNSENNEILANSWQYNNFTSEEENNVNLINVDLKSNDVDGTNTWEFINIDQLNQDTLFHGNMYEENVIKEECDEKSHQSPIYSNAFGHADKNINAIQSQTTDFPITIDQFFSY